MEADLNNSLLKKLAKQKLNELQAYQAPDVLSSALPYQKDFILDPAKRKVVCSTRRSAKSWSLILNLVYEALKTPNAILAYLTLTNASAKRIVKPILQQISDKYKLGLSIDSSLEVKFKNGSIIYLIGLDSTSKQMDRLRGNKYDLACIDEAQDFTTDLREVIENVLDIALAQSQSSLIMAGTPSNNQGDHYFYVINKENSPETQWKTFFFEWKNNTSIDAKSGKRICDSIQAEIDAKIAKRPEIIDDPSFKQEWMGKWVIETSARVYKSNEFNYIDKVSEEFLKGATYSLALDLGFVDATAFTVIAFNSRISRCMYVIESEKHKFLTITAVAGIIKKYIEKYKSFNSIIVDAANLQAVEEMRQIHSLPLQPADKPGKESHIAIMNSDFITRDILIIRDTNKDLIKELDSLVWDQRALQLGKHKENQRKDNHLTDSLLYAHSSSRHFWFQEAKPKLPPQEEYIQQIYQRYTKQKDADQEAFIRPFWETENF